MIVTSVQIKTVKMQKHLYCPVFTHMKNPNLFPIGNAFGFFIFIKDISYNDCRKSLGGRNNEKIHHRRKDRLAL